MGYFVITGTDTGVGKTWTSCALATALRHAGHRVVAIKPLETGCGSEVPIEVEDGVLLANAARQSEPRHALLRLSAALAPAVAADREGVAIDFDALLRSVRGYGALADVVLVEGAGGLLSPLTWQHNAIDLARALGARVMLVALDRLGVIHHTLLALKHLALSEIDVAGVVLIEPEHADGSTGTNAAAVSRLSGFSRIVEVRRTEDAEVVSQSMQRVMAWLGA